MNTTSTPDTTAAPPTYTPEQVGPVSNDLIEEMAQRFQAMKRVSRVALAVLTLQPEDLELLKRGNLEPVAEGFQQLRGTILSKTPNLAKKVEEARHANDLLEAKLAGEDMHVIQRRVQEIEDAALKEGDLDTILNLKGQKEAMGHCAGALSQLIGAPLAMYDDALDLADRIGDRVSAEVIRHLRSVREKMEELIAAA